MVADILSGSSLVLGHVALEKSSSPKSSSDYLEEEYVDLDWTGGKDEVEAVLMKKKKKKDEDPKMMASKRRHSRPLGDNEGSGEVKEDGDDDEGSGGGHVEDGSAQFGKNK